MRDGVCSATTSRATPPATRRARRWTRQVSSGSTAAVDTAQARSGTKSVKFVAASGSGSKTAYIRLASTATKTIFPVTPNVVYGRMMFRLEAAPTGDVHWTFLEG